MRIESIRRTKYAAMWQRFRKAKAMGESQHVPTRVFFSGTALVCRADDGFRAFRDAVFIDGVGGKIIRHALVQTVDGDRIGIPHEAAVVQFVRCNAVANDHTIAIIARPPGDRCRPSAASRTAVRPVTAFGDAPPPLPKMRNPRTANLPPNGMRTLVIFTNRPLTGAVNCT